MDAVQHRRQDLPTCRRASRTKNSKPPPDSLRHTFASLGRTAGESAFNVARMMGHAKSTLVDQLYAYAMQSGMTSVASAITARAFGEQPKLRLIDGGQRDIGETLENTKSEVEPKAVIGL